MVQTDICCYLDNNNYTTGTRKRKSSSLTSIDNKSLKSVKKQKTNNGERIIDLTKEDGTVINAFISGNNHINDNNDFMKDVKFSFPNQDLTEFNFKLLKSVMMIDSPSTIENLIDQTITDIRENFSLTTLRQGHTDIFPEFNRRLSLNSSKFVTNLLLTSMNEIQQNL